MYKRQYSGASRQRDEAKWNRAESTACASVSSSGASRQPAHTKYGAVESTAEKREGVHIFAYEDISKKNRNSVDKEGKTGFYYLYDGRESVTAESVFDK